MTPSSKQSSTTTDRKVGCAPRVVAWPQDADGGELSPADELSVAPVSVSPVSQVDRQPRRYRYEWALFADWCVAADTSPLPASPIVIAEFLADNPAGDAVQIRRVSAINRHHRAAGAVAPGTATTLRLALDSVRAERVRRRSDALLPLACELPTVGGIEALFGRRDAVLLMLAGAGLSYTAISMLTCDVVSLDGDDLWIAGDHRLRIHAVTAAPGQSAAALWERWYQVLQFADRYPSTALLTEHLANDGGFSDASSWSDYTGPVAVPIDRWGHMPFPVDAMSAAAIAGLVTAHQTGASVRRISRTSARPRRPGDTDDPDNGGADDVGGVDVGGDASPVLDDGYYDAGIAARRRAHDELSGVTDLFDDVEDRIEQLLQRTLDILGDADLNRTPSL